MAKMISTSHSSSILFSFFLILLFFSFVVAGKRHDSSDLLLGKEKMSHLRFYWHDVLGGRNPTAVQVASAPMTNNSPTGFGMLMMIDDMLTEGPKPTSKLLGRAQGFYGSASQEIVGLIMAMNFAFMDGKYNGSTLTVLGRNTVLSDVREMPVIGGSGLFRFARGYAHARTNWFDPKTGDAIVEYNVHVIHY